MTHIFTGRCYQIRNLLHKNIPIFSVPNATCVGIPSEAYITSYSHPGDHSVKDVGFYYKIKNSLFLDELFKIKVLEPTFVEECKTFRETALMVRKPALEVIHYLKNANYDHPINKYVLYGKYGNGVTLTMLQAVYYAHLSGWLIIHLPWVLAWAVTKSEVEISSTMKDYINVPTLGVTWLVHFRNQNAELIKKLDLRLQNSYTWNIQEANNKGESLLDLVDYGISRAKYSCDVILKLLEELKEHSKEGRIRTLLAIDGFSSLFQEFKKSGNRKRKHRAPNTISCLQGFKNMAEADWHNGAAILSCYSDPQTNSDTGHLPLNQLTRKGFEFLDPFVPIEVPKLTEKEMVSVLTYYRSQKWLLRSDGDRELKFLCDGNFLTLRRICGPL